MRNTDLQPQNEGMKEQTSHYCLRQNFSGQQRGRIKDSAPLSPVDGAPRRPFAKVGRALRWESLKNTQAQGQAKPAAFHPPISTSSL